MLWWAWLGLNMGSTFGVSGHKWKYASRAAVITMVSGSITFNDVHLLFLQLASSVGGMNGLLVSYITRRKKFDVILFIVGLLSSLVSVSAGPTIYNSWDALYVAFIGSLLGVGAVYLLALLKVLLPNRSQCEYSCASN